jgi:hypothetical protein
MPKRAAPGRERPRCAKVVSTYAGRSKITVVARLFFALLRPARFGCAVPDVNGNDGLLVGEENPIAVLLGLESAPFP